MDKQANRIEAVLDLMRHNWPDASAEQAGTVIATQRLARLLQRVATRALAAFDLTPTEFELLAALRVHPAPHVLTPSDLYASMLMSSGGLTKLLKGLEAKGLILRTESGGDRRVRPVALSAEGRTLITRAMAAVQKAESPMMAAMRAAWRGDGDLDHGLLAIVDAAERVESDTDA